MSYCKLTRLYLEKQLQWCQYRCTSSSESRSHF